MARFCRACGAPVGEAHNFCRACGARTGATPTVTATAPTSGTSTAPPRPAREREPRRWRLPPLPGGIRVALWIALVVGLVLSGIGWHGYQSRSQHQSQDQSLSGSQGGGPGALSAQFFSDITRPVRSGSTIYRVTYQPQAVVFDQPTTMRAVQGISEDWATYTLDAGVPAVSRLKRGTVFLLYGIALRRVTSITPSGRRVIVATTEAELTDLIKDGHIEWTAPIDFDTLALPSVLPRQTSWLRDFLLPESVSAAASSFKQAGAIADWKWDVTYSKESGSPTPPVASPNSNLVTSDTSSRMKIQVHAAGTLGGAVIDLKGIGYIDHFQSSGSLDLEDGQLSGASLLAEHYGGGADLYWTAQQQGHPIAVNALKIKFPMELQVPLVVGPLPLMLSVSFAFIVQPGFTSNGSYATGHVGTTFGGSDGFHGIGEPSGKFNASGKIDHDLTSIAGVAANGYVVALEAPRIELAVGLMSAISRGVLDDVVGSARALNSLPSQGWFGVPLPPGVPKPSSTVGSVFKALSGPPLPVFYVNNVVSIGQTTGGVLGALPLPGAVLQAPCTKLDVVLGGNAGIALKLNLDSATLKKLSGISSSVVASAKVIKNLFPDQTTKVFQVQWKIYGPYPVTTFKLHPAPSNSKCLGE
jgi:hypothetical protein